MENPVLIPMWNIHTSTYLNPSDAEIECKAFVIFYINVLWPDEELESFQRQRNHNNELPDNRFHQWNLPVSQWTNVYKWFPTSIFPQGPEFDNNY